MTTFNSKQVQSFSANNPYIQYYYSLVEDEQERRINPALCRYIVNTTPFDDRERIIDVRTYRKNVAHYHARLELINKFGETFSGWSNDCIRLSKIQLLGYDLDIYASMSIQMNGECVIHLNKSNDIRFSFEFGQYQDHILKPKNIEFSKEGMTRYLVQFLQSKLYGNGHIAKVQINTGWNKSDVKVAFQKMLENKAHLPQPDSEDEFKLIALIEKRLNCKIGWNISAEEFLNFARTAKPFDKTTTVDKYDFISAMEYCTDHDGDIDEIENRYYDTFEDNTFYI